MCFEFYILNFTRLNARLNDAVGQGLHPGGHFDFRFFLVVIPFT